MTTRAEDDSPTIVDAFVAGDEHALAEIYSRWSALVYNVALRSLEDVAAAEAVTQQVFTQAWTSRHSFAAAGGQLPTWLIEITRTKLAAVPAAAPEPADLADRLILAEEISRLAATSREVIRMALVEDLTHTEIAERLSLPVVLVKSHLRRSLFDLRERLAVLHGAC